MTALPDPMTPADCDLSGLEWMPMYGERLLTSETWLLAGPEGRVAALTLWWAAWKQNPAGSLPDNDRALSQLAGFGGVINAWLTIKEEAMRGFVKCSDGRLYHPVVSELAKAAFEKRQQDKSRKAAWRSKRNKTVATEADPIIPVETEKGRGQDADETGTGRGQNADVPSEIREEKITRESKTLDSDSLSVREPDEPRTPSMPTLESGPGRWMWLTGHKGEIDDRSPTPVRLPTAGGYFLIVAAKKVCEAARIDGYAAPVDWRPLVGWLEAKIDPDDICAAIRSVASHPAYEPVRNLKYFDKAVRERRKPFRRAA